MNLTNLLLFLKCIDGVTDTSLRKMIVSNCFKKIDLKTLQDVLEWLNARTQFFSKTSGKIKSLTVDDLREAKKNSLSLQEKFKKDGVTMLSWFDDSYPDYFRAMGGINKPDFPVLLFCKGDISLLNGHKTCAIIGTRTPSEKAKEQAAIRTKRKTDDGYVIVSGLAAGCDTIAHQTCLDNKGKTIAILGNGFDYIYPAENKILASSIVDKGGLLITEYTPNIRAQNFTMVERDRLQAALSDEVIVIQTSSTGGTMHAATKCKNEYKKQLYVVNPRLVDDGDYSGIVKLINEYFAKTLD